MPGKEYIPNGATLQCHFPFVVIRAIFDFSSRFRPMWWYPDFRSKEENNVHFHNLANRSVMFGKG